jgi:hypothetical protein
LPTTWLETVSPSWELNIPFIHFGLEWEQPVYRPIANGQRRYRPTRRQLPASSPANTPNTGGTANQQRPGRALAFGGLVLVLAAFAVAQRKARDAIAPPIAAGLAVV